MMKIKLKDTKENKLVDAQLIIAKRNEMPSTKTGWKFEWDNMFDEKSLFYKIILDDKPNEIQGIMKCSIYNSEMFYLENIEVSPNNYGKNGKYDYVTGCLLAYACKKSKILGIGSYEGWVVFDSKTVLVEFYKEKYGAKNLFGSRMVFDPETGDELIATYLK